MEPEPETITFDVQHETIKTYELYRISRTSHAPLRYQLLVKVDDD
jgi:hypothetical protein